MNTTLESAHLAVSQLVREFKQNEKHYLSASYVEASLRADFLDKFWKALGWDVSHDVQTNPAEQEVKIERNVQVAMAQKRADYAFFFAPNYRDVRFFVEAKKPSVDLDRSADAHFQTLRYGWNANTPLAVLTDFEQVFVLDCRAKPDIKTAIQRTHKKFHYTQFLDREIFAEFYWLFSREALASGALDRAIAALPKPSGKAKQMGLLAGAFKPVDESFLDDLEQYRETLAKAFKRDNPDLDGFTLTEVTQRVLDRLVFLRFLEDKLIETDIGVSDIARAEDAWAEFVAESKRLDGRYNGGVYRAHPLIDTGKLKMGGDEFRDVCEELGNAHSPYNFNAIPIHILGSIYERFLGKVVTTTDKRAKIEEKPEVRKAGGVYYTPEYIVRYIVDGTVGNLIDGKTPAEIARLRFADIACGSGSFALTVFDTLLAYHTHWYNDHPDRAEKDGCAQNEDGAWRLTLSQRRKILLNNVYGVDIDRQAVEVTQVSLYLKLLEEETTASAHQFELQLHDTLLPSLTKNIVCGNSLIGTDILTGQMFAREEERALNPMDFEDAFPEVMRAGGFDALVGNPPYIRIQTLNETNPQAVSYFGKNYRAAGKGNYDIYVVFVEQALRLLGKNGVMGYILPHKFFNAKYGEAIRGVIAQGQHLQKIVHFGDQQVFDGATTYTCLLFLSKKPNAAFDFEKVKDLRAWEQAVDKTTAPAERGVIESNKASVDEWNLSIGATQALDTKYLTNTLPLGKLAHLFVGLQTDADDVFILNVVRYEKDLVLCKSNSTNSEHWFEIDHLKPFLKGSLNIRRYQFTNLTKLLIFPYQTVDGKSQLISRSVYKNIFPLTWDYLQINQQRLASRNKGQMGSEWYGYVYKKNHLRLELPKLLVPAIGNGSCFALDSEGKYYFVGSGGGGGGGYGIILETEEKLGNLYLLGILNSKFIDFRLKQVSTQFRGGYIALNKQYIEQLPIRPINFDDPADVARHDKMVSLVDAMLDAKKKLAAAQNEAETDYYTRRCDSLDRQIDTLVYELYSLTQDEIAIVEGRDKKAEA